MGWKRHQIEEKMAEKRLRKIVVKKGEKYKRHFVSQNSDNRHYCWGCDREKYCYDTKEKAELAAEYNPYKMRVYYCDVCCAYHTTCKLSIKDIKRLNNGYVNINPVL